jgi:hypothetical protein
MPKTAEYDEMYFVWDGLRSGDVRVRGDGTGIDFVHGGGVLRQRNDVLDKENPSRWATNSIAA